MLKYYNYDIVFQEIPNHTTLAINLTGCPFRCAGCHSPHLREDIGEPLDKEVLLAVCKRYDGISCVCLMGGDANPGEVAAMGRFIKAGIGLKSAWYSGADELPEGLTPRALAESFDFVKLGNYREEAGGLKSPDTNQRLYAVEDGGETLRDITPLFWQRPTDL